jgi:uncharacterized protein
VSAPAQTPDPSVTTKIAGELGVRHGQVVAAVELLDGGATVPFIARYRKEATGALDERRTAAGGHRLRGRGQGRAGRGRRAGRRAGDPQRAVRMLRGEKEEILDLELDPAEVTPDTPGGHAGLSDYEELIAAHAGVADQGRPGDRWLAETVHWAWRTRFLVRLTVDLRTRLWQNAEQDAVGVFAANLRDLLLAAPAGAPPRAWRRWTTWRPA